ncbi:stage 0 sporulation protein [Candidatus Falkowbacteria bacterium]|nr:stage 0 sporulation protein [Candidatus Falkowbacteria bacterium]
MKIAEVQFNNWDKLAFCSFSEGEYKINDYVIFNIDTNLEIGKIVGFNEIDTQIEEKMKQTNELQAIIRKANLQDLEKKDQLLGKKEEALNSCKKLIEKNQLDMKLVDVHFSFDDKKIIFAFIADGRIDFRLLVKDLIRHFQKNIRLQQLGVRDEAKIDGDIGACGLTQCCKTYLKVLGNVNAEHAEAQQISHRGAERLSGICNRLKCCLRYENDLYVELSSKFPPLNSKVRTPRGRGEVIEWHVLKQTVSVKLEEDNEAIVEIPLENLS